MQSKRVGDKTGLTLNPLSLFFIYYFGTATMLCLISEMNFMKDLTVGHTLKEMHPNNAARCGCIAYDIDYSKIHLFIIDSPSILFLFSMAIKLFLSFEGCFPLFLLAFERTCTYKEQV